MKSLFSFHFHLLTTTTTTDQQPSNNRPFFSLFFIFNKLTSHNKFSFFFIVFCFLNFFLFFKKVLKDILMEEDIKFCLKKKNGSIVMVSEGFYVIPIIMWCRGSRKPRLAAFFKNNRNRTFVFKTRGNYRSLPLVVHVNANERTWH